MFEGSGEDDKQELPSSSRFQFCNNITHSCITKEKIRDAENNLNVTNFQSILSG